MSRSRQIYNTILLKISKNAQFKRPYMSAIRHLYSVCNTDWNNSWKNYEFVVVVLSICCVELIFLSVIKMFICRMSSIYFVFEILFYGQYC